MLREKFDRDKYRSNFLSALAVQTCTEVNDNFMTVGFFKVEANL